MRLQPPAVLAAAPGGPGVLHQAHPGGQERPFQAVQLRLGQERKTLPQRCPQTGEEGWVSPAGSLLPRQSELKRAGEGFLRSAWVLRGLFLQLLR